MQFIFTVSVSGLTTRTFTNAQILIFLSRFPYPERRCRQEVDRVMTRHPASPDQSRGDLLKMLSLQKFEARFPVLGTVLQETLRLQLPSTMFRTNETDSDIVIARRR